MTTTHDEIRQELEKAHPQDLESMHFYTLFMKCTPEERARIRNTMRQHIESERMGSIAWFKKMPLALEGLPASKLMDVVEVALSDAYDWIAENFPQAKDKLSAYDSLVTFYLSDHEKSERDMREVIGAICKAWDVTLFPVAVETPKPTAKAKSRSARAE